MFRLSMANEVNDGFHLSTESLYQRFYDGLTNAGRDQLLLLLVRILCTLPCTRQIVTSAATAMTPFKPFAVAVADTWATNKTQRIVMSRSSIAPNLLKEDQSQDSGSVMLRRS